MNYQKAMIEGEPNSSPLQAKHELNNLPGPQPYPLEKLLNQHTALKGLSMRENSPNI
jgi:hypothetical protein